MTGLPLTSRLAPIQQHSQLSALAIRSSAKVLPPSSENEYAIEPPNFGNPLFFAAATKRLSIHAAKIAPFGRIKTEGNCSLEPLLINESKRVNGVPPSVDRTVLICAFHFESLKKEYARKTFPFESATIWGLASLPTIQGLAVLPDYDRSRKRIPHIERLRNRYFSTRGPS